MALTDMTRGRLGSQRGRDYRARHPCQGPSNQALFGLPVPVPGQVVGKARQRRSQSRKALISRAADFSSQINLEAKPAPWFPTGAYLPACHPSQSMSVTPQTFMRAQSEVETGSVSRKRKRRGKKENDDVHREEKKERREKKRERKQASKLAS